MRRAPLATATALLLILAGSIGCDTGNEPVTTEPSDGQPEATAVEQESAGATTEQYAIRGTVTAVNRDEPSVTIDHEEIEGLMDAMTMKFPVNSLQALEGIEAGDQVQGELIKKDDQYVITEISESTE